MQNNVTGEVRMPGHAVSCSASSPCGCSKSFDAEGNITSFDSVSGGVCAASEGGSCSNDAFTYDGNNRLTYAHSACNTRPLNFTYDARGRLATYTAGPDPSFEITRQYSDSTGRWKTQYTHEIYETSPVVFVTEYKTDAAGRLTEVWRSGNGATAGRVLAYAYGDSQSSYNMRVTRDGVGYSDYYLDTDGAVRQVAHYRADDQLLASYTVSVL